jgi:hypothetical protein
VLETGALFEVADGELNDAVVAVERIGGDGAELSALAPVLTSADLATLAQIAARPIPLHYVLFFECTTGVETATGAEVDVSATEWVGAKPVLAAAAALQAVIAHYPDVSEAVAAGEALAALSSAPASMATTQRHREPHRLANILPTYGRLTASW